MTLKKLYLVILLASPVFGLAEGLPDGWDVFGSNPNGYEVGIDTATGHPAPSAFIFSKATADNNLFSTVMQSFDPVDYRGKRLKLSAWVQHSDVMGWAGLWMRIDVNGRKAVAFDNMKNRPIIGAGEWQQYRVVLDIPQNATNLAYGVLLTGKGKVWMDDFSFEIVDISVETTDKQLKKPMNTGF